MPGLQTLNTCPQKWAAVVSGTVWKRWALSPSGTLEAQTVRGPVIVWAKPAHGEEEAPKLEAPKPTPLDLRVWAVNTAAHFEKFRRAARGRVRASVRWKTGRMVRRARVLEALDRVRYAAHMLRRKAEGRRGFTACMAPKTAKRRRAARREWESERFEERLRDIAPVYWLDKDGNLTSGWDVEYLDALERNCYVSWQPGEEPEQFTLWKAGRARDMLTYALLNRRGRAVRAIVQAMKREARQGSLALSLTLRALEAAAYRAHVRRRVRPARRADRVPRPVHTRPRPPSAPLAPPVTC